MKVWAIARTDLVRFFRDPSAMFTVFVLPVLIVLLLGAAAGGSATPRLGFVAVEPDGLTQELEATLQESDGVIVEPVTTADSAVRRVERGELQAALIVPAGYQATLRSGGDAEIRFVARAEQQLQGLTGVVESAVTRQATLLRTARFVEAQGVASFETALAAAEQVQASLPPVDVVATTAGEPFVLAGLGQFDIGAQTQLVLFIFLTTLAGAVTLIQTRNLGVAQRMYTTPTTVRTMLAGAALGRLVIALIQGGFILVGTWLIFGVDWGDPVAAVLVILVFAMVSTGAAMLLGGLVHNDQQAGGIATGAGLGIAALGGAMIPLAVFELLSETVYRVAHVTPHAWALEAFQVLVAEDGGIADILGYLGILLAYAVALFAVATWRLRRVLVR